MPNQRILRFTGLVFLIIASVTLSGCGTIFGGLTQDVSLTSDPSGVEVHDVETGERYMTPQTVSLSKSTGHILKFTKDGYRNETVPLRREARFKWWVLDAFTLGIANVIDASTGGLFDIKPSFIHVALDPVVANK